MAKMFSVPKHKVHKVATGDELDPGQGGTQEENLNWAEMLLGIPDLWSITEGSGINVAILDTGISQKHPDLMAGIVATKDFTGSPNGVEDMYGHGSHVAGIIGARKNDIGFVGIAPQCNFMIGKVLADDGYGEYDWISDGIRWAVDNGAHIINMSLGGPETDPALHEAICYALMKGVIVCCAAGNEGSLFQNSVGYPGRYGGVITVASHDSSGRMSGFSSRGGEVDVMAPGDEIWSTYMDGMYATLSGTSMATPFVCGLCALILSKHQDADQNDTPIYNTEDMKNHLLRMAAHPGWHDNNEGYGALMPFQYFYQ